MQHLLSSSREFDHEIQYKHTTTRPFLDFPINQLHDVSLQSHPDSMYQGHKQPNDTNLLRLDSHGKSRRIQDQLETTKSIFDLRSDWLHPMGLEQVAHISPPIQQPMWQYRMEF